MKLLVLNHHQLCKSSFVQSPDMPTTPREPIRRITSSYPNDPKSPFFDPTGEEMKPLARLYLTRQRLYEKSCTGGGEGIDTEEDSKSIEAGGEFPITVAMGI